MFISYFFDDRQAQARALDLGRDIRLKCAFKDVVTKSTAVVAHDKPHTFGSLCKLGGDADKRVRLIVRDHGSGFADHILKRAFEPYVTTKVKGTGLGLAVVKKIADEHSARIDISNRMRGDEVLGAQVSLSFGLVG